MRMLVFVVFLAVMFPAQAGFKGGSVYFSFYDQVSDLYYQSVKRLISEKGLLSSSESSYWSNIGVFNPGNGKTSMLFPEQGVYKLAGFLFEKEIKDGVVQYEERGRIGARVLNNKGIAERAVLDRMLVVVVLPERKATELWVANKDGTGLRKITKVQPGESWHLDAKNRKIRVVRSVEEFSVQSFDW